MAAEYFLYTTLYNNTLVNRSKTSFAPLPPDTGEIYINYFIPTVQPLYYYRESGATIVLNDDDTINNYLQGTAPPPAPEDYVEQQQFTGYTATTATNFSNFTGTTLPDNYYNKTQINAYSASTLNNINTRVFRSGDTMTGTLCSLSNILASGAVTGSSLSASALITAPVIRGSTSICAPQITGSTCIQTSISCASTRVQSPVICASTCSISPIICGTSCVQAPTTCATTLMRAPTVCGGTCVKSPVVSGGTTYAATCLCSQGTTRLVGATTAASTLNVSGNTRLGSQLYFNTMSTGGTLNDYQLVYDPATCVVRSIPQGSGGTAYVYCYTDCAVQGNNTTTTNATYLSATWSLPAGRYEMEYNAIYGNNTSNRCAIVCFLYDTNLVGSCNLMKTNDTNVRTTAYVTQDICFATSTSHTVSIVYRQCGGGTASVFYGAIRFRKTGA